MLTRELRESCMELKPYEAAVERRAEADALLQALPAAVDDAQGRDAQPALFLVDTM